MHGQKGSYGDRDRDYGPYSAQVVWEADNRWFEVSCDLDQAGILAIAERVRADSNPVLVPFRLESVPEGVRMTQLIEWVDGRTTRVSAQFEQASEGRLTMEVANRAKEPSGRRRVETVTIKGRKVEVRRESQTLCLATRSEPICVFGPGGEPASDWSTDARQVADETVAALVPAADSNDKSTWFSADDAFPL